MKLMTPTPEQLEELASRYAERWPELREIFESATEIAVFGSYAVGCHGPGSDLDVFAVCDWLPPRHRFREANARVDLLTVAPANLLTPGWLGSELALHVSHYGRWIYGSGTWRGQARLAPTALRKKQKKTLSELVELYFGERKWSTRYIIHQLEKCTLDLQRLTYLTRGEPAPPRTLLMEQCVSEHFKVFSCTDVLLGPPFSALVSYSAGLRHSDGRPVIDTIAEKWDRTLKADEDWRARVGWRPSLAFERPSKDDDQPA